MIGPITSSTGQYLLLLASSISKLEIFLERLFDGYGSKSTSFFKILLKPRMILYIEFFKTISRLYHLLEQKKTTILLHWGNTFFMKDEEVYDIENYRMRLITRERFITQMRAATASIQNRQQSYKGQIYSARQERHSHSPAHSTPHKSASRSYQHISRNEAQRLDHLNDEEQSQQIQFIGSRTGTVFQLPSSFAHVLPPSPLHHSSYRDPDTIGASEEPIGSSASESVGGGVKGMLNWEQMLTLAEVLYVIRPAYYALLLHNAAEAYATRLADNKSRSHTGEPAWPYHPSALALPLAPSVEGISTKSTTSSANDQRSPSGSEGGKIEKEREGATGSAFGDAEYQRDLLLAWIASLVVEVTSVAMTAQALRAIRAQHTSRGTRTGEEDLEEASLRKSLPTASHPFEEELSRRKLALMMYLIRSPFFDRATMPLLREAVRWMGWIPLVGGLVSQLIQILKYFNHLHFYTAASS